jgi:hypothetical protein
MAFNYSPKTVTDGLVLYLDAANPNSYVSGSSTWIDLSRNNLNGTLTNGPTYNSSNGGVIIFDGTNDYVNCGNSSVLDLTDITISVWYKTTATGNQILVGKSYLTSYYLNVAPSANSFSLWTNGTSLGSGTITTLGNGNWHNVVGTMSGVNKKVYYDGALANSGTGTSNIDSNPLYIGSSPVNAAIFNGSIANVLLYNRALSIEEVQQNFNTTKTRFGL